jgi:hypothetical protein
MLRLYIGIIIPLSILIPLIVALYRYHQLPGPARSIFHYLIFSGIINCIAIVLARNGINNLPLLHLYTVAEFALLTVFYRQVFAPPAKRLLYPYGAIVFAVFCVINAIFFQSLFSYNTFPRTIESLLLIIMALLFFYKMLSAEQEGAWYKNMFTWFNIGLLLYFSGSLSLFLLSDVLLRNKQLNEIAWIIHASLVLVMYILFAGGFLSCKRIRTHYPGESRRHKRTTLVQV